MAELKLIGGTSNPELTNKVCNYLKISPIKREVSKFSDGEAQVEIHENVRGREVFVLQSTCPPVNDNFVELLVIMDALKRASVKRMIITMPYYGYARQDRKVKPRAPISAKMVADCITAVGARRVISMDLHAGQIQGYFDIPVDNIYAKPLLINHIKENFNGNLVIVSPDAGGVERARSFAKALGAGLAIIDKRREAANVAEAMNVIGEVDGKTCIILDDMVDTAGTITEGAKAVKDRGALDVFACAVHPVLSGPAIERIENSVIKQLIVTDTMPLTEKAKGCAKIEPLSIAPILAETIKRSHECESVSSLFV